MGELCKSHQHVKIPLKESPLKTEGNNNNFLLERLPLKKTVKLIR